MLQRTLACLLLVLCACGRPASERAVPAEEAAAAGVVPAGVDPIAAWLLACRAGQEGFGWYPGDSAFTSCTGMALEALAELGALEPLEGRAELIAWIQARQQPDGGFIESGDYYHGKPLPWGSPSALEPTWWAVRSLELLGAQPRDLSAVGRFIHARLMADGGYEAYEYAWGGAKAALYTTFWAVAALKALGLPVTDSARTVEWVRGMQQTRDGRGGFSLSDDYFDYSSVAGTGYAIRTLALLGARPERPEAAKAFLLSSYGQEADGGFELGHGDRWNNFDHYSRMQDTFAAVLALELLRMPLADSDSSRAAHPRADCAAWIASLQNPDGGFGRLGVTDQTPLPSPSEMQATWQAVRSLRLLDAPRPSPRSWRCPADELQVHRPLHLHPVVNGADPAEVWAYRRIALPIYEHYLAETGSSLAAVGMVMRWVRAAVGPENGAWITGGRGILMHGWGQCGAMSWLLQSLLTGIDLASRASFVIGDVNLEVLVREEGWAASHWCLLIPFTNEWPDPALAAPDGSRDGWSALDLVVSYNERRQNLNYPSLTELGDHLFATVRIETIDTETGRWGREVTLDTTSSYGCAAAAELYPDRSW